MAVLPSLLMTMMTWGSARSIKKQERLPKALLWKTTSHTRQRHSLVRSADMSAMDRCRSVAPLNYLTHLILLLSMLCGIHRAFSCLQQHTLSEGAQPKKQCTSKIAPLHSRSKKTRKGAENSWRPSTRKISLCPAVLCRQVGTKTHPHAADQPHAHPPCHPVI